MPSRAETWLRGWGVAAAGPGRQQRRRGGGVQVGRGRDFGAEEGGGLRKTRLSGSLPGLLLLLLLLQLQRRRLLLLPPQPLLLLPPLPAMMMLRVAEEDQVP